MITNDKSPEAAAILSSVKKKVKYHEIDVNAAAKAAGGGVGRTDIVKKLNYLNERGHIKLNTRGVEQRYLLQKELPKSKSEIDAVLDKLYAGLANQEKEALRHASDVMDLITGRKCFALAIAEHFGMGLPDGKTKCGHCTVCFTGKPVKVPSRPLAQTTAASIQEVLEATNVRDDPRFLARVAYGIRSPRISQLKLDKVPAFRSLAHHDFEVCPHPASLDATSAESRQ